MAATQKPSAYIHYIRLQCFLGSVQSPVMQPSNARRTNWGFVGDPVWENTVRSTGRTRKHEGTVSIAGQTTTIYGSQMISMVCRQAVLKKLHAPIEQLDNTTWDQRGKYKTDYQQQINVNPLRLRGMDNDSSLQRRTKVVEMRCYRRLLHDSKDHTNNEAVWAIRTWQPSVPSKIFVQLGKDESTACKWHICQVTEVA